MMKKRIVAVVSAILLTFGTLTSSAPTASAAVSGCITKGWIESYAGVACNTTGSSQYRAVLTCSVGGVLFVNHAYGPWRSNGQWSMASCAGLTYAYVIGMQQR